MATVLNTNVIWHMHIVPQIRWFCGGTTNSSTGIFFFFPIFNDYLLTYLMRHGIILHYQEQHVVSRVSQLFAQILYSLLLVSFPNTDREPNFICCKTNTTVLSILIRFQLVKAPCVISFWLCISWHRTRYFFFNLKWVFVTSLFRMCVYLHCKAPMRCPVYVVVG